MDVDYRLFISLYKSIVYYVTDAILLYRVGGCVTIANESVFLLFLLLFSLSGTIQCNIVEIVNV